MGHFIEGFDRHRAMLLPECIDEDTAVRVIDEFVGILSLTEPHFTTRLLRLVAPAITLGLML